MTRMADSFHNISASYMMKNRPADFVSMEDYIKTFEEKLASLDRISQRILKEEFGETYHLTNNNMKMLNYK